jgi:hypothetical protein
MSGLGLLLSVVALDGCGIAAKVEARNDMMTAIPRIPPVSRQPILQRPAKCLTVISGASNTPLRSLRIPSMKR